MWSLTAVELVKLRRHSLVWLGAVGAVAPVLLNLAWYYAWRARFELPADRFVSQGLFILLLEGPVGAAIIGGMLFGREYTDRTLPNLLVSAVPRGAWMGAKWAVLGLLGLGVVMASWAMTMGSVAAVMGWKALSGGLVAGSAVAYLAAAAALYATSAIAVGLTLATRNPMVGIGWGVAATMGAVVGLNSKYSILFPGSVPWVAGALAFEAAYPSVAGNSQPVAAQFAWTGLPAGLVVTLVCVTVWVAGLAFSLWHVRHADFA